MSWRIAGSYFETCSCEVVCPCTASLSFGATNDYCRVVLVFNVKEGEVEGVDVSGLTVAAVAETPRVMTDGNWRLGVFIDAAASDEQAEKLGGVFSGALGGPMEALGPLIGENLGVERATIEVREDGLSHSVKIGDATLQLRGTIEREPDATAGGLEFGPRVIVSADALAEIGPAAAPALPARTLLRARSSRPSTTR